MGMGENTPMIIETGGGSNGGGGLGGFGEGGWIFIILFVLILFGLGGNGIGNRGGGGSDGGVSTVLPLVMSGFGNCGGGHSCATAVADGFALQNLQTGISGINNNVVSGFYGVDRGLCDIGRQISDCCCQTQGAIKDVRFDISNGLCGLNNTIQNVGRDIMDKQDSGVRAILDFLTNDKIDSLRAENQALKFQASQTAQNAFITANQDAQTAELIRRLGREIPVPAYVVPNPNCCYGNPVGVGYGGGYGNGCGCNNCGC